MTAGDPRGAADGGSAGLRVRVLAAAAAFAAMPAQGQLTIQLEAPSGTPDSASIFVAGSFNGWNPASDHHRMSATGPRRYALTLPASVRGSVEFKFTRGSWERVELDSAGAGVANRSVVIPAEGALRYSATVGAWRDGSPPPPRASTARRTVTVMDTAFAMPQLDRARRVWIYLPPDYATSGRRYPVLYMHDGQNVFDDATSFAGEWGVDEALDSLHAAGDSGAIVVAVDHGGPLRIAEYNPWVHARHGGGDGDEYVEFLVQTLKPYIDRRYRTRPDRSSTGIAGSSMGGLISLYAVLRHPEVFGRAAVFSPSLWIAPEVFALASQAGRPPAGTRLWMVTGGREGSEPEVQSGDHRRMADTLQGAGWDPYVQLQAFLREDGTHSEGFWRREFPAAYRWLFQTPAPGPRP
jgi:predicted alpha/beta superfamily hydrolase